MIRLLTTFFFILISVVSFAQTCPGDVIILEDENLTVWEVATNGTQIFSLAEFAETTTIGGTTYTQPSTGLERGLILMAHDINGNLLWSRQLVTSISFFTTSPALAASPDVVYVAAASIENSGNRHDLRIESFAAPDGTPGWTKSYPVNVSSSNLPFAAQVNPYSAKLDGTGNLVIAGAFSGSMDIGGTVLTTTAGLSETFVMSVNETNGTDVWAVQSTGSTGRGRAWTLEIDNANNILIGGHFTNTITLGSRTFSAVDDKVNPYVAKLNNIDGSAQWLVGMQNVAVEPDAFDNIYDITVDPLDNIYFAGNFNYNLDIQGTTITSGGETDMLIGSLDSNGVLRWAKQFGGLSTGDEFATSIVYSTSLSAIFVGGQLATDAPQYGNITLDLPPTKGHYVIGLLPDGSIEAIAANAISQEDNFGYSATYIDASNTYISASLISNSGTNISVAQWVPNRPAPLAHISLQDGVLNPTETLTAFDPGGGIYTYQWYFNGEQIPDEVNTTYSAGLNGFYSLEVTNSNGCSKFSDEITLLDGSSLASDSIALVDLYKKTDGANWNDNTNWLVGNISTWAGVSVNLGRVSDIYLGGNNLSGNIPSSIGNLSELNYLHLNNNQLSSNTPASLWNLSNLIELVIHDNPGLNFSIGQNIEFMSQLQIIRAYETSVSGTLPVEIGSASSLIELNLNKGSGHSLSGPIPNEMGNLSNLQILNLGGGNLTGVIPTSLGNLTNLTLLDLSQNELTGGIPTGISTITTLQHLNVRDNNLSGSLQDAIWQLPSIQVIQVDYNQNLTVTLPSNLSSLTNLTIIGISGTVPIQGPFPSDFYALTNLQVLDVGGHRFTGTLTSELNNLTNLTGLWLFSNLLTGDFPDISALTSLQAGSIAGNQFTSFPDISSLPQINSFGIQYNQLGFDAVLPNLSIAEFNYAPQNVRGDNQYIEVAEGASQDLINDYTTAGNVYQWVRNAVDSIATTANYTISAAQLPDLGGYFAWVTNPSAPDLTLRTPFYNVSFTGAPRSWTVDNDPESLADFKSLYAGIYGTNTGDTLYVAGSDTPYYDSNMRLEQQRVIYGPGYFLGDNPETQANTKEALAPFINIAKGSEGTQIYGMTWDQIFINNQSSAINDTVSNVQLVGNKIRNLGIVDDAKNILIDKNFIEIFELSSTPLLGVSRSYIDITVKNNIIDTLTSGLSLVNAAKNVMQNVVFDRNTIDLFLDSIADASVTNNIINNYLAAGNNESGTIGYAGASFADNALLVDNDFVSTTNVDAGAFSGTDPYVLSGIPPAPHIFDLIDAGRIRFNVKAKNENAEDIVFLNYKIGQGGTTVLKGTVRRLEAGNPVEVLFRPKVSSLTPGGTYNMMIWTKDANGVKSVHHNASFTAETATAGGQIFTSTNQPITNGEVLLFEINQEQTAFDTLQTTINNQGQFTFGNIVVGDYLALGKGNLTQYPDQLPTYFAQTDLWEEADTLLIDASNPTFNITLIEKPKEDVGPGVVAGILEEELDQGGSGGRIEARGRVKSASVSMRRARRTSRSEEIVYDLVEYVFTNDNGEFFFDNLPVGEYRINIQYPGYPMDTLTNVDIVIEDTKNNDYSLEALVDNGKISVTILSTTGILKDLIRAVNVYPNPSVENINISFNEDFRVKGNIAIDLIAASGENVLSISYSAEQINQSNELTLPVSQYQNGTYLLRISQEGKEIGTIRILVTK